MISRSVAQIATASMRTSTSAFLGTGTGLSFSINSPGLPSTQAFIVSGIGKFGLVLTPAGAYMLASPYKSECGKIISHVRGIPAWQIDRSGRRFCNRTGQHRHARVVDAPRRALGAGDLDAIAAALLGAVERLVGQHEQARHVDRLALAHHHA